MNTSIRTKYRTINKGRGGGPLLPFLLEKTNLKKWLKNKWIRAGALTLVAVIVTYFFSLTGVLQSLELKFVDLRFRIRGEMPVDDSNIVIVAIDDQSFVSLQQKWPFPRSYFARAVQNLTEAGARLIIFDIEFLEPSPDEYEDLSLAKATAEASDIIFAGKIVVEYGRYETINRYVAKPLKSLIDAGGYWAFANIGHDTDGFIRRYNLFQNGSDQIQLPLGVEALKLLQPGTNGTVIADQARTFVVGNILIPKYTYDSMLINYYGPAGTFPTYSFANILDDVSFDLSDKEDTDIFEIHKSSGTFQNKIVMIGASAEELQDNKFTPFFDYDGVKRKMPGVEMHANALQTILNEQYLYPLPSLAEFLLVIVLSGLAMMFSRKFKPYVGLISGIVVIGLFFLFCLILFIQLNTIADFMLPVLAFVLSYGVNTVSQILTEQREKGLYRKTFQQYVAPSVVDTMLNSGELPKFGGEHRHLTVLFSDIRSFTTYCERHSPETVVQRLSEYLSAMVDVIFRCNGTLDKFVGDEIMALFGAPYYYENHAERACETALEMVAQLQRLRKQWALNNIEGFTIGIGINTGKMIVGNLGSIQLFDYTVIGDEVNLGARLEGANKFYSTTIIISEATYLEIRDKALVRELDVVRVKGRTKPVRIYELCGMHSLPTGVKELIIDTYSYGLELFRGRKWYLALKQFRRVLRYFPNDGPSRLYTQRCLAFIEKAPPFNWDGVIDFTTK